MGPKLPVGVFYGNINNHRLVSGIRLTESLYSPAFQIPKHSHESPYFGLVLEGSYAETYGSRHRDCSPSTLLFHPAEEQHAERHEDAVVRIFNIELPPEWQDRIPERSSSLKSPGHYRSGMLVRLARRLYGEFLNEDALSPLAIEGLTLEMLAAACRRPGHREESRAPAWLGRVKDLLREHFAESLPLETVALEVGVHQTHLCRVFRRHCHCTIGDYVRSLRIEQVGRYLAESDIPLSEIALAVGYSDQSHFSTAFKRRTGVSPARFRKAHRGR